MRSGRRIARARAATGPDGSMAPQTETRISSPVSASIVSKNPGCIFTKSTVPRYAIAGFLLRTGTHRSARGKPKPLLMTASLLPVSYTHLRAHETRHDLV